MVIDNITYITSSSIQQLLMRGVDIVENTNSDGCGLTRSFELIGKIYSHVFLDKRRTTQWIEVGDISRCIHFEGIFIVVSFLKKEGKRRVDIYETHLSMLEEIKIW